MSPAGNVSVGFDAHGVGYYASAALGGSETGYFVITTTNGIDWGTPNRVVSFGNITGYNWAHLAVDGRSAGPYAGSLYMFWFYTDVSQPIYYQGARLRYSRDGGRTWSGDIQISDETNKAIYYPYGTVASDGSVYVAFKLWTLSQLTTHPD
jgi:hypothetical protein